MHSSTIIALSLTFLVAPTALGEEQPARGAPRDQIYVFEDDPLDAVGLDQQGDRLRVRRGMGRVTLIRPRTHFVHELTRSVENL